MNLFKDNLNAIVLSSTTMRNRADSDTQLEQLGNRLDHATAVVKLCTRKERRTWKYKFWKNNRDYLLRCWRNDITLKDIKMQETFTGTKYNIDYTWFEHSDPGLVGDKFSFMISDMIERVFGNVRVDTALEEAFTRHKEERLRKGQ